MWSFRSGDQHQYQNPAIGFREIYNRELVTAFSLCQLTNSPERIVIKEGVFRTTVNTHSGLVDSIYKECTNWPTDLICQLKQDNATVRNQITELPIDQRQSLPSNKQLLLFLLRLVKHKLQHLYKTFLRADQWNIGVVNRPIKDFLDPQRLQGAVVEAPALPNRNVFYADCFVRQETSGSVVYFEEYDYRVRRGNISKLNYPWPANRVPARVLDFPFHLSYPFLFGPYCMPEAWVTKSVRLYDLSHPVTNPADGLLLLSGVPAVDSTLLRHENRYWLFYTRTDRDAMLNLFISYADSLEGPWHDHPQNPVKSDIRSSRPGGPFFSDAGRLYRPAQNCARDYGCGITVNEVLELTPVSYREKEVAYLTSLHPDYPSGMHTITALDEHHTLIDFKRYRFIPWATLLAVWIWISPVVNSIRGKKSRRLSKG